MRKIKFTASLLLALLILFTFPASAVETVSNYTSPSQKYRNDDYYYEITEDEKIRLLLYIGDDTDLVIPDTIDGYPVTTIADLAFMGTDIETLEIPKGILRIGGEAFANCQNLTSVRILSDSYKTLFGTGLFRNCQKLESVTFSDGPLYLGDYMFYNCSALKTVTLPTSATSVPIGFFAYCNSLREVRLDTTSAKVIEMFAFYGTEAIDVHLPTILEEIQYKAFACIDGLSIYCSIDGFLHPQIHESAFNNTEIRYNECIEIKPGGSDPVPGGTEPTSPIIPTSPTSPPEATATPTETEPSTDCPSTFPTEPVTPEDEEYIPGKNFIFSSNANINGSETEQSLKAESYKEKLLEDLVEVAWDVRIAGDANLDGKVNIKDSTLVQKYIAKIINDNTPGFNFKNADIDTNGTLDVRDATLIQKRVAQLT